MFKLVFDIHKNCFNPTNTMPEFTYFARTSKALFEQIANDIKVEWLGPYGEFSSSYKTKIKRLIVKILNILTGGDVITLINDILTPLDIANHIYPANKVKY
eukprot:407605_1